MIIFSWNDSALVRFSYMTKHGLVSKLFLKGFRIYAIASLVLHFSLWGIFLVASNRVLPSALSVFFIAIGVGALLSLLELVLYFFGNKIYIYEKWVVIGGKTIPSELVSVELSPGFRNDDFSFFIVLKNLGKIKTQVENSREISNLISALMKANIEMDTPHA